MPAVARRLAELNPATFSPFEALGLCTIDGGSDTQIADLARLYRERGKQVYAVCDKQTADVEATIRAEVDELFMHPETGFEDLVLKNTTREAMNRFIDVVDWPPHLKARFPNPKSKPLDALLAFFKRSKGDHGIADFLVFCSEQEIPEWIKQTCISLKDHCEPKIRVRGATAEEDSAE